MKTIVYYLNNIKYLESSIISAKSLRDSGYKDEIIIYIEKNLISINKKIEDAIKNFDLELKEIEFIKYISSLSDRTYEDIKNNTTYFFIFPIVMHEFIDREELLFLDSDIFNFQNLNIYKIFDCKKEFVMRKLIPGIPDKHLDIGKKEYLLNKEQEKILKKNYFNAGTVFIKKQHYFENKEKVNRYIKINPKENKFSYFDQIIPPITMNPKAIGRKWNYIVKVIRIGEKNFFWTRKKNIRKSMLHFSTYKRINTKSRYVKYKPWLDQDYELQDNAVTKWREEYNKIFK